MKMPIDRIDSDIVWKNKCLVWMNGRVQEKRKVFESEYKCEDTFPPTTVYIESRPAGMGYTRFWSPMLYQYYTGWKIGKTILYAIPILYQMRTANLKG